MQAARWWIRATAPASAARSYTLAMHQTPSRVTVELSEPERELIEGAARLACGSVADFVRDAAIRAAKALRDDQTISFPKDVWEEFAAAVDRPGQVQEGLARLLAQESVLGADGPSLSSKRAAPTTLRSATPRAVISTLEVVRLLSKHLGRQLLAITVDASATDVERWEGGDAQPAPVQERRLREALEVWQLVVSVESIGTTRGWWMGMKEQLGDLSPAEAIAADRARAVMSVAHDFVEGG